MAPFRANLQRPMELAALQGFFARREKMVLEPLIHQPFA
jgi:hypothetical protein